MHIVVQGVLIGVIATVGMDVWAAIAKHLLHLPTSNWAMVGRWFGHMPRGVFVHRPIAEEIIESARSAKLVQAPHLGEASLILGRQVHDNLYGLAPIWFFYDKYCVPYLLSLMC